MIFLSLNRYSRRLIWLKVGPTNNDPSIVAGHFLEAATNLGGNICSVFHGLYI